MTYDQLRQDVQNLVEKAAYQANRNTQDHRGNPDAEGLEPQFRQIIEPMFEPFYHLPDPASYDPLITDLQKTASHMSAGSLGGDPLTSGPVVFASAEMEGAINGAKYCLLDWTGDAAEAFRQNFLNPYEAYTANQYVLVHGLLGALDSHKTMWAQARHDIDKIAHSTLDGLDNLFETGSNGWGFALTVLASIASVGAAIVTAGGSTVLTLSLVGAAATIGAGGTKLGDSAQINGGGGSVEAILDSMKTGIDTLTSEIQNTESKIQEKVNLLANGAHDNKEDCVAPRPKLTTMPDRKLTSDAGLGEI